MSAQRPLRLLFLTDQLSCGGAERHLVTLAAALAARGHRIAVAGLKAGDVLEPSLIEGGVDRILCCNSRGGLDLAAIATLARTIDREAPAVLVATSQYSLMFGVLARKWARRSCALAFICHSMGVVQRGSAARLRFLVYRQFYAQADSVIFVSRLQRDYFAAMGIAPPRRTVVSSGVDLQRFAPHAVPAQAASLGKMLGVDHHALLIGMCAVLREEKRHSDMLEAVAALRREGLAARLLLVGDGPMRARIAARIAQLALHDAVLMPGFLDDVRPAIALCDVMALTSDAETFPIASLEYLAMGKPVVASDVGGMREQIEHDHNGLLYPCGDIAALSGALALCADPATRARLGRNALISAHERFSLAAMVARYEALFAGLSGQLASRDRACERA